MSEGKKTTDYLDKSLRPNSWETYIGQAVIKRNLQILLQAAKEREQPADHLLFYGPPGLGKTTLAHLIAKETGRNLKTTSGPAIEKVGDLASILTNLESGDILFIDEIHRLNKMIEEVLYPAMESGVLDIIIGKGPSARTIQLDLPPFTLVAATTKMSLLSAPLRSRFSGGVHRLEYYTEDEIGQILSQSAKKLDTELDSGAIQEISKRSRSTPRTANYFLKRCRDYAQVKKDKLNDSRVKEALELLGVDDLGLFENDRFILRTIIEKFGGGPVGLKTIAAATGEDESTIEDVIEPYMIQQGLLDKTPRGRVATDKAYEHLQIKKI